MTATTPTTVVPDGITLKHHSPTIGTEVLGIDLREPLSDEMFGFLHQLFLDRKVIFFRDQFLTPEQHLDFGRRWGDLEIVPFLDHDDTYPELLTIRRGSEKAYENVWHSDVSWREEPSMGSILRALKVPEFGGDTLWCDMTAAYDALSPGMKDMVENLRAVHTLEALVRYVDRATIDRYLEEYPPQEHPVVRTHPETGTKMLYVNIVHTRRIVDVSPQESAWILGQLYRYADIPEFQCRFRWEAGSIAFWDNRSTQHYAVSDHHPQERFMDRVTVKGDRPF
ncbi:MAG: TauD/TfdA dioxygenase family protein [Dermatophilaceae bacterium]